MGPARGRTYASEVVYVKEKKDWIVWGRAHLIDRLEIRSDI
jgi:hypothetical protein